MLNVVIPCWNARDTLPALLDSLVVQTKKLFITTIIQDGDGLDYSDIITEYRKRGLKIEFLQNEENIGPGNTRQRGIDHTQCDYIMFCDSDDLLMPRAVEVLYNGAKQTDSDIFMGCFLRESGHNAILMNPRNISCTWFHGKVYKVNFLREKNIRFLPDLMLNEDAYFNLVATNVAKKKNVTEEQVYIWRDNKDSLTRKQPPDEWTRKSWEGYVRSQVQGLLTMSKLRDEPIPSGLIAATFINIYDMMMTAKFYKVDITVAKEELSHLKEMPEYEKLFENPEFWKYIGEHLKATKFEADKLIFFDVIFTDWLKEYVKGEK